MVTWMKGGENHFTLTSGALFSSSISRSLFFIYILTFLISIAFSQVAVVSCYSLYVHKKKKRKKT